MTKNNRILLFLILCIPIRLLLSYFAYYLQNKNINNLYKKILINLFSIISFLIGISFLYQYYLNRKIGFFGGEIYWSNFRLLHSFNYILFSILFLLNYKNSYLILLFDVILGLLLFIKNYFI